MYLVVRDGQLWGDVNQGLSNEARLVGLYKGVTRNDSGGFLDLHQHVDLLQTGLYTEHTAHRNPSNLQAKGISPLMPSFHLEPTCSRHVQLPCRVGFALSAHVGCNQSAK